MTALQTNSSTTLATSLEQSLYGLQVAIAIGGRTPEIIRHIAQEFDVTVDEARDSMREAFSHFEIHDDAPWTQWLHDDAEWARFKLNNATALGPTGDTPNAR